MIVPVPMPFTWRGASAFCVLPGSAASTIVFWPRMLTTEMRAFLTATTIGVKRWVETSCAVAGRLRLMDRTAVANAITRARTVPGQRRWSRGGWVIDSGPSGDPYEAAAYDPFVTLVFETAGVDGYVGVPFWTDAALIAAAGIPTVLFGPIGEGAHAEVEWVDLDSLDRLRDVVVEVAHAWCA